MTDSISTFTKKLNEWGKQKIPFVFLIDYLQQKPIAWQLNEVDPKQFLFNLNGFKNDFGYQNETAIPPFTFDKKPIPFDIYQSKINHVIDNLKAGNSFLVNLSVPTPIQTNLTLQEIYHFSNAPYRCWLKDQFVCFSPEIFIRIKDRQISSFPMKGTIDASIPNAENLILSDHKEGAEHATIVDLIRNDLSMVAQKVWVEKYRYIDRIQTHDKTLLQVSSEVAGLLPDSFQGDFGDLLIKLLPAGSISGAPKPSTMKIIAETEQYERGYYTGIVGYFDGETFESAVMIRYIENQDGNLVFKSGGGITAQSQAENEYQELIDKVYLPFNYASPVLY